MFRSERGARVRFLFVSFIFPLLTQPVYAQDVQTPRRDREIRRRLKRIVPEHASCFRRSRQGTALHLSSGLISSYCDHVADFDALKQLEALLPEAFTVQATGCGGTSDYLGGFANAVGLGRGARMPWGS
jgi:hypothetical protein